MKSIQENKVYEETIKNSKFICLAFRINDKSNVKTIINEIKNEYKNATHYCYAYKLINDKGFSDDGEPNKTAGVPMLTVIEKEELINVLIVVVRYFGGIKLGPGGLIRAYTKTTKEVLKIANKIDLIDGYNIKISFPYSLEKEVNYILKDAKILKKEYLEECIYNLNADQKTLNKLEPIVKIETKEKILIPR